jgi:hypothetical protein
MQDQDIASTFDEVNTTGPGPDAGPSPAIAGGPTLKLPPPPRRGWFMFRRTFDAILGNYLLQSLQKIREAFDGYRDSFTELPGRVELMKVDEHLGLCLDLLATSPTLSPSRREFRPSRQKVVELLGRLQQATEQLGEFSGTTDELRSREAGSPDWIRSCGRLVEILVQIEERIRKRRELS